MESLEPTFGPREALKEADTSRIVYRVAEEDPKPGGGESK